MAAVSVQAHNNRIEDAETTTGWTNEGGGGGIATEPDIVYQGSAAASRKVSTSYIGRGFLDGATHDFTAADRTHAILKINATNYSALNTRATPALGLRIGNSSTVYYEYYAYGNDNYPITGGWQFVAIDPSVTGYRDATGSTGHDLTAVDFFAIMGDFSSTAKAENLVIDAIDNGAGLTLSAGDGASADGTYQDFIDHDEGTSGNRYGYVHTKEGAVFVLGRLAIGQSGTSGTPTSAITEFTDATGKTLIWLNGYMSTGFARHRVDLGTSGTVVSLDGHTYISNGEKNNTLGLGYTSTEDTRTIWEVTGTTGTLAMDNLRLVNFQDVILTSGVSVDGCDIQTEALTQGSANLENSIVRTTSVTQVATLADPTFGVTIDLNNTEFIQEGAGHAIELDTAGNYTFTNITFTGYGGTPGSNLIGNSGANDAAVLNSSNGSVTISVSGGNSPSVRNSGASSSTTVQNTKSVTITVRDADTLALLQNIRVFVKADTGGDLPADDSVTITRSGTTASVSHTAHGLANGDKVLIEGANETEYNGVVTISNVTTNAYDYTVSGAPATPATGTITSTAVIIDEDTSALGVADNTAFVYTNDQPITGVARKGTASPYYKEGTVSGTITTDGYAQTVFLVKDE